MIAKGHDFPNVTLVGILAADLSLNLGTYQAAENCFQLITQAAGRAGRGELAGRVFIQTYQPENHAIRMAAAQDYEGFYQEEILLRQAMEYPPFSHIFSVLITGEMEQEVILAAQRLGAYMNHYAERAGCTVVGPAPAPLPKFRGEFRWQIFAKGTRRGAAESLCPVYCRANKKRREPGNPLSSCFPCVKSCNLVGNMIKYSNANHFADNNRTSVAQGAF